MSLVTCTTERTITDENGVVTKTKTIDTEYSCGSIVFFLIIVIPTYYIFKNKADTHKDSRKWDFMNHENNLKIELMNHEHNLKIE